MVDQLTKYNRKIILENGAVFYGYGFGSPKTAMNELVFHTAMVGYQEIVTDPSCTDQMVVMTYPLIGNYGITDEDNESQRPTMGGIIVREYNDSPSNFRYTKTLSEVLEENDIPGISGLDTRMLTRIIRDTGSQKVIIVPADRDDQEALCELRAYELPRDAVNRVTSRKKWYSRTPNPICNVVAVDCGIKLSFVRSLNRRGVNVTVVRYDTPAEEILRLKPDGLFISNGPGNPEDVKPVIELIKALRGKLPIFGVCLGHQLISLAYGAKTYKLKFGHRGGNHPIQCVDPNSPRFGKVEVANQYHSYAVDVHSIADTDLKITHLNLLDQTCEGVCCERDKVFSVQYQPDGATDPEDGLSLFDQFVDYMREWGEQHA